MAGMRAGRDEDALSEIVGFVLVLALVVVASTLYLLYVVPAEGREDEITHMNQVKDRFVSYKTSVDGLWLRATEGVLIAGIPDEISGTRGASLSTSFDLGTGGGNTQSTGLFLSFMKPIGTAARMSIQRNDGDRISVIINKTETIVDRAEVGSLNYTTDNYYWIQQIYSYEMGGVFLEQPGEGVSVKVAPALSFYPITPKGSSSDVVKLSLYLINVMGDGKIIGGTGPLRVDTRLREDTVHLKDNKNVDNITVRVDARKPLWAEAWKRVFLDAGQCSKLPMLNDAEAANVLGPSYYVSDVDSNSVELHIRNVKSDPPPAPQDVYLDLKQVNLQVNFEYAES